MYRAAFDKPTELTRIKVFFGEQQKEQNKLDVLVKADGKQVVAHVQLQEQELARYAYPRGTANKGAKAPQSSESLVINLYCYCESKLEIVLAYR